MAIYEFRCDSCGHLFELKRGVTQRDDVASCPQCSSLAMRQISLFASPNGGVMQLPARKPFRSVAEATPVPARKAA